MPFTLLRSHAVSHAFLPVRLHLAAFTLWCCCGPSLLPAQPHLFRMDKSTGSPPDFFDPNGQNWGFPTYNWEAMADEGYAW
jgi:hypothetical protein